MLFLGSPGPKKQVCLLSFRIFLCLFCIECLGFSVAPRDKYLYSTIPEAGAHLKPSERVLSSSLEFSRITYIVLTQLNKSDFLRCLSFPMGSQLST